MTNKLGSERVQPSRTAKSRHKWLTRTEKTSNLGKKAKKDEEDSAVRYEPITEPFLHEGRVIFPCYCILPFVTDEEVDVSCRRPITVSTC